MTPHEKLEDIKKECVSVWPLQGYKNSDIIWLIKRIEQLEELLRNIDHTEEDIFEALNTGPKKAESK